MRYLLIITTLLAMSCGEDEPDPTFEELIIKVDIVWDPDDPSIGGPPSEMEAVTCSLESGTYKHCYSLDSACGAGKMPTVCFDDKADLVACKRGIESELLPPGEYVVSATRKKLSGEYGVFFNIIPNLPYIICED
jgi:hypothetical protein